jgi:cold shock CspA family protein
MGRSQETFNKKEVRKKKEKKRKEKEERKQAKKEQGKSSLDDMIAYVDAHGNITDTPPEENDVEEINAEDIEVSPQKLTEAEKADALHQGRLKFFNESKGFGFITDQDTRESIFVHINDMIDDIREGDKVEFEREKGQKGPVAVKVRKI